VAVVEVVAHQDLEHHRVLTVDREGEHYNQALLDQVLLDKEMLVEVVLVIVQFMAEVVVVVLEQ
jgi:hypothetical protein